MLALLTFSRVFFLLCAALALYLGAMVAGNGIQSYRLGQDQSQIQSDIATYKEQHRVIQSLIEYMKTDDYVEYIARRDLGMVMPGELSVVVISPQPEPSASSETATRWWQAMLGE